MSEDYRNRLVRDVQGIVGTYVEGDRPLYRHMAESITDYIVRIFNNPKLLNRQEAVDTIAQTIENIFGFDLTGHQHDFNREDEDTIRDYYNTLTSDLTHRLRNALYPILSANDEDQDHNDDAITDIVLDSVYNTLAKRGYLRTPYTEFIYTYILPNGSRGTININIRMTIDELYDELRKRSGGYDIRIYSKYGYLSPESGPLSVMGVIGMAIQEYPLIVDLAKYDNLSLPELQRLAHSRGYVFKDINKVSRGELIIWLNERDNPYGSPILTTPIVLPTVSYP